MEIGDGEYYVGGKDIVMVAEKGNINNHSGRAMWIIAVSYTHLDVYKRQAWILTLQLYD